MVDNYRELVIYQRDPDFDSHMAEAATYLQSLGRTVLCSGCFDLLHEGHHVFLTAAAEAGDVVIVAMNSDSSVRELKGADRPIEPEDRRASALLELPVVQLVVVAEGRDARTILRSLRPTVFVVGPTSERDYPEETAVARALGAEVLMVERRGNMSTTRLVEEIRSGEATDRYRNPPSREPVVGEADGLD